MMRQQSSHLAPQDELDVSIWRQRVESWPRVVFAKLSAPLAGASGLLCFAYSDANVREVAEC